MNGYNSVSLMRDGTILVEVEDNTPVEATFDKEKGLKVGNMILPKPIENREHVIKVIFKA
ncbi:hypothetical protein [Viridibacillus arvi]|uniref:hypothetical protein n=1 Tax=Viridibacillus arvi TaxID=263475 RepID=UPI0034CF3922